jgi:hypothetical protein
MCLQAVIKNTACQVTLPLKKNLKSSAPIKRIPKRLTGSKAILQGGSLFRGQTSLLSAAKSLLSRLVLIRTTLETALGTHTVLQSAVIRSYA